MPEFYISSTKYSIQERNTKKGKVYDAVFRIIDPLTLQKKLKSLCGYRTKTELKEAYTEFITSKCERLSAKALEELRQRKQEENKKYDESLMLVSYLANEYFNALRNQNKDATIYEKQKIFDLIILPRFGTFKIDRLTIQELYRWQDELWAQRNPKTGDYYSYKYLSKIRTYFSAFLTWASTRYEGIENNLTKVKKPKRRAPQKKMQFWTREEFDKFIKTVTEPMYRALFCVLFFTGRRKGEVLALTTEDIDLQKGTISFTKSITRKTLDDDTYKVTSTKTELQSATPICETLLQELKQYEGGSPFYFGGDTPITDNTLRRVFNRYAQLAELKQIRIHDLRHSFVSMCIHLGATIPVVADLIGDTIAQVTKTYAHLYEDDKRKIIEKIG